MLLWVEVESSRVESHRSAVSCTGDDVACRRLMPITVSRARATGKKDKEQSTLKATTNDKKLSRLAWNSSRRSPSLLLKIASSAVTFVQSLVFPFTLEISPRTHAVWISHQL